MLGSIRVFRAQSFQPLRQSAQGIASLELDILHRLMYLSTLIPQLFVHGSDDGGRTAGSSLLIPPTFAFCRKIFRHRAL